MGGMQATIPMPFIVGAPRSGTTLLRFMLDSHHLLAIPPETGFLMIGADALSAASREEFFRLVTTYPPEFPAWQDFDISLREFAGALEHIDPFECGEGLR